MNEPLFRRQAAESRSHRGEGRTRIVTPPSFWYITLLLMAILTGALTFLVTSSYTRKETVAGVIEAGSGLKRIYVPRAGTLSSLHVSNGQFVSQGDILASFEVQPAVRGESRDTSIMEYERQQAAIRRRDEQVRAELSQEQHKIDAEVERLGAKALHTRNILDLEREKVRRLEDTNLAALPLYQAGQLSRIEWGRFEESLINARQRVEQLASEHRDLEQQARRLEISKHQVVARFEERLIALEQEGSRVEQAKLALTSESGFTVRAPVGGRIANVFFSHGASVTSRDPIVSIREHGATLRAKLLIPSRNAGFVEAGQDVRLLYDAFPHQQFGTFPGKILRVSSHALLPGDLSNINPGEPMFEALVAIESDTVTAYGESVALRSGMSLKADIMLDHRTLIEWLLEPLFAKRGRTS